MNTRANYALIFLGAQLGPDRSDLAVEWAEFCGDKTDEHSFTVPTSNPIDPYIGIQAFHVGDYGHEIQINAQPLGGFDIPPHDGWQYWMDALFDVELQEGTNTVRVVRDTSTTDAFALGNISIHWKEQVPE